MSLSGNGADGGARPRQGRADRVRVRDAPRRPGMVTPEQTCLGCSIGIGALLLVALFWGWIFWRQYQAENAPRPAAPPAAGSPRAGAPGGR